MVAEVKFWNNIAQKYSKKDIDDIPSYEHKLEVTRRYMTPQSRVIEVGCGTGSTALLHARHVGHILATDLSPAMLDIANSKANKEGIKNVEFLVSSVEELKVCEATDMVMAMSLLHLLEDKDKVIKTIFDWLKPGGVFVSTTVCLGDNLKIFKYIGPIGRFLGLIPYVSIFTVEELKKSLINAGFEIEYQWSPEAGQSEFFVAKKPE